MITTLEITHNEREEQPHSVMNETTKFIFAWIVDEMTFSASPDFFSFSVNGSLWLQSHAEPTLCKKTLQRPDFEAIYLFNVNSYHTSAAVKSIPYQSMIRAYVVERWLVLKAT